MKRILFLVLPLTFMFSLACEGPSDELEATAPPDAAVEVATQMIKTHVGMEKKKASWLLPVTAPKGMKQARWEELRMGTAPPLSTGEREVLGMEVNKQTCADWEQCDVRNCNGIDEDGYNLDNVSRNEYPTLPQGNYAGGWGNCTASGFTYRCGRDSGGMWYVNSPFMIEDDGEPMYSTVQAGEHFWFTDQDMAGYCMRGINTSPGQISDLGNVYPGNVFRDTITSMRWSGGCTSGGQKVQIWNHTGFQGWPFNSNWTSWNGPSEFGNLGAVGWNDAAAALKVCVP